MGTGFDGDNFDGQRYFGVYEGYVVDRDDPQQDGRVRVRIPGMIDDRSAWARPRGGGSKRWGKVAVPPDEADVLVQFINGDIDRPIYEPFDFGHPDGDREMFPEHDDPDVIVMGFGPFRLVVDLRDDVSPSAMLKQVHQLSDGSETDTAWIQLINNSIQVHADSAVEVDGASLVNIKSAGDIQIKNRKVLPNVRPIS